VHKVIILFYFLLVSISNLGFAQSQDSINSDKTMGNQAQELNAQKNSSSIENDDKEMEEIDKKISYYFLDVKRPSDEKLPSLKELVIARQSICLKQPKKCLPLSHIMGLCSTTPAKGDASLGLFWKLYISTVNLANDSLALRDNISGCSPVLTEGKWLGYLVAIVMAENKKKWKALSTIISALTKENVSGIKDIQYLKHLSFAVAALERSEKFPLDIISTLISQSLVWAQKSTLDPKNQDVEHWLTVVVDTLPPLGREVTFTSLLPSHPELRESNNFHVRSIIARLVCNYARQTNQFSLCDQQLALLGKMPEARAGGGRNMLNFMHATNMLYAGQRAKALAAFQAMVDSPPSANPMLGWYYLMLGIAQIHSGDYKGAQKSVAKHMELLPKNANQLNSFMGPGTALSILVESGQYAEARTAAERLKVRMVSNVRGPFESLVWVEFNQLFLNLQIKDKVAAEKSYKDLSKHVELLPLFQYIKLMGQALVEKSKGQTPNIEPIKKILGPNHYEVQHLQRLLEKLK
jgi:tetratricopeptide (TPR) repeat protein